MTDYSDLSGLTQDEAAGEYKHQLGRLKVSTSTQIALANQRLTDWASRITVYPENSMSHADDRFYDAALVSFYTHVLKWLEVIEERVNGVPEREHASILEMVDALDRTANEMVTIVGSRSTSPSSNMMADAMVCTYHKYWTKQKFGNSSLRIAIEELKYLEVTYGL